MTDFTRLLLVVVLPAVVAASLIEAAVLAWRARTGRGERYDFGAMGVSLADLAGRIAMQVALPAVLMAPLIGWVREHRLGDIAVDGPLAVLALFLGQELCYYAYHRAAHRVRWFWCNHAVHHSPNQLNLSAAYRIGIFGRLTGSALFYLPLVWLGFPPLLVFAMLQLNLLYQFWLHATWIPKLGWLEGILNTPSAHRVHHAANVEYLDANYGGVLMVFDRLFGTYVPERDDLPCRYGLVTPLRSNNPLRVEFHQWLALAADLARARSVRAVAGHLFGPPGWRPDGSGGTTEDLRRAAAGVSSGATLPPQPR